MLRWVLVSIAVLAGLILIGLVIVRLTRLRAEAEEVGCKNNLRQIALFASRQAAPDAPQAQIPSGTLFLPGIAPDERLSWVVEIIPSLDQKRVNSQAILDQIDRSQPWPAAANQVAGLMKIPTLLCPGNPAVAADDAPKYTQYLGIAGVGANAARLPLLPFGLTSHDAGCFRYDAPTPVAAIRDGLSTTLLFGERSGEVGPWLRGGPSTVRGLVADGDQPLLGPGGQFGGCHPGLSNWAMADGSVRTFTDQTAPRILLSLATIAGDDGSPDE